ncbi:hypothetical protein WJX72_000231 [[Myrmecia] bisecta]|uniref:Uncharacterized protein n=1 Tax=[Myrmecia] bisecta TaxID=41462 RepID=A0AAW1PRI3_9CHLO
MPFGEFSVPSRAGFPELDAFVAKVAEKAYDNLLTLRLFTGFNEHHDTAGTVVPVTPLLPDGSILAFTNWHCVYDPEYGHMNRLLMCTPHAYAPWNGIEQVVRLKVELLDLRLPKSLESLAQSLHRPSSPSKTLKHTWENADLALVRILDWSRCQAPPPSRVFVPSATPAAKDDKIVVISTGGKVDLKWAKKFLAGDPDVLDNEEAWYRQNVLRDCAYHEQRRTVSPGTVHAANEEVVEHTASVLPGCSGGAGVSMHEPWKLLFYHTQGQASTVRK